jgi:uncharacterized protein
VELTLFLDHDCNLRCSYCYNGQKFSRPMPVDTMKKAVQLALAQRPPRLDVSFFGGEPLLHPELVAATIAYVEELAASVVPRQHLRYVMNTNGTILDSHILGLLSPPRPFTVYVSLDGPAEIHDAHRRNEDRQGSYATVTANLERLRGSGVRVCLVAVVRPESARHLGDTTRILLGQGSSHVILTPDLRAPWTEDAIAELHAGLRDVGEVWKAAFRRGRAVLLEPLHGKILTHLKEGIPCPERCTLAGRSFAVAPSGRLYACAQMIGEDRDDHLVIGTVDAGFDQKRLARLQQRKDHVELTCAPCALRERCQSHCGCRHLALTGELGQITQALCDIEESFILAADEVASTMMAEKCSTFIETYYRQAYRPADGASMTRMRRPSDPAVS